MTKARRENGEAIAKRLKSAAPRASTGIAAALAASIASESFAPGSEVSRLLDEQSKRLASVFAQQSLLSRLARPSPAIDAALARSKLIEPPPAIAAALTPSSAALDALNHHRDALLATLNYDQLTELLRAEQDKATSTIEALLHDSFASIAAKLAESVAMSHIGKQWADQINRELSPMLTTAMEQILDGIDTTAIEATATEIAQSLADRSAVIEAAERSSYRALLYDIADRHQGFVTTTMAAEAGIPAVEVRKVAARGGLTNVAHGLYRADGISSTEKASFAEAVFRSGEGAHLYGDAVLAFHDLALVNPRRIKVGTCRRVRRQLPAHIELVRSRAALRDLTEYDGVPSTTVEHALRKSIGIVMPDRLADATERAADEGLLRRHQAQALLADIGQHS